MIKVIAFDLGGVLIKEKHIVLSNDEDALERLFGPNISDEEFINQGKLKIGSNKDILSISNDIINKLYEVKDKNIFDKIKNNYPNIKIIIATNHISLIRNYIENNFNIDSNDIVILSEINKIKPNSDYYNYILDKYNIKPNELLFIDDSEKNINGALRLGINTIKIERDMDVSNVVLDYIKNI